MAPRRPRGAITDRLIAPDAAYLQNAPGQFNNAFHWIGPDRCRIDAVKRRTRPRQIEMRHIAEKNSGRIGERRRNAGIEGAKLAKHFQLDDIERVVGKLGASKVAEQQRDTVICSVDTRRKRRGLRWGDAEAVHASIDMQRGTALPA